MTSATRAIDVLLVEDDPGDELITREAFEHNKINNNLHVAHDGEEGLDFLYRRGAYEDAPRPDLILLDLNLPKYDGRQLLEKIKSDIDLCHIPVVVLTTSSAEEDILQELQAARQRVRHQAGGSGPVHERGPPDRRILRPGGQATESVSRRVGRGVLRRVDVVPLHPHPRARGR